MQPSSQPTIHPTSQPTIAPSISIVPTAVPSREPSETPSNTPSTLPTAVPSREPSEMPSNTPSTSPTAALSREPSLAPSSEPSISQEPTFVLSFNPSDVPSLKPSFGPSRMPSPAPSLSPTKSIHPSQSPTKIKAVESSIIINQSNTRNATPLLIVGACFFAVVASTSMYLYQRDCQPRQEKRDRAPAMIEVSAGDPKNGGGMISPYSSLGPRHGAFDVNYSESESRVTDGDTLEYDYTTKEQHFEKDGEMVDIDLEAGVEVETDAVPNSVSIIRRTQPPDMDENNNFPDVIDGPETPGNSRLRMPKSIYVPKMFQRTKEGEESSKQVITWNQIREEDRSHASSGYAPASVPSPMLSPFLVKGVFPGIGKRSLVNEPICDEVKVAEAATTQRMSTSNQATRSGKGGGMTKSPVKEIVVKREASRQSEDVFAGLEDTQMINGHADSPNEQQSPKTVGSKSSDASTIEWGIDVPKVEQPSKASFEANMAELQNLLVSIKSMGSNEAPTAEEDVDLTYTEDSSDSNQNTGSDSNEKTDKISPKSDVSTFLGNIDIAPIESNSTRSESSSVRLTPNAHQQSGITFERELLNSNRMNDHGTFNFRNIFNDPKNDLYQCHAPSGPLGIVVDTTPLGPRVRSLNPLSPIFGKISPGDVIVGVDEVDTVGMEAGDFWKVVSRKANQQERILTILRI